MQSAGMFSLAGTLAVCLVLASFAAAQVGLTQLSEDTFTNNSSQHATEVEPGAFTWGATTVTAFQVARGLRRRRRRYRLRDYYGWGRALDEWISAGDHNFSRQRDVSGSQRRGGRIRRAAWGVADFDSAESATA